MIKVTGSLQKSTEIMKMSNALIKLPQISQVMREMSMEMTKVRRCVLRSVFVSPERTNVQAGIMDEMLEDTLEVEEDEQLEEEADAEVDKVLYEYTNGTLGRAGTVQTEVPVSDLALRPFIYLMPQYQAIQDAVDEEETERAMESYRQQLNGLLSG